MNFWTKALVGIMLIAAAIAIGVALAPYVIGGLVLWLAWRWMVGSADSLPEDSASPIIDVRPNSPAARTGWRDPRN